MKVRLMESGQTLWHSYLVGETLYVLPMRDKADMYVLVDNSFNRRRLEPKDWRRLAEGTLALAKKRVELIGAFSNNKEAAMLLSKEQ